MRSPNSRVRMSSAKLTVIGFGTIALLISYLPVLYGAYNRREARLLTLDDPSGDRIMPVSVIQVNAPDGDIHRLYAFFADWELWTAEILESHVSYPMLAYFRSQHIGQSWVTALGVVLDAATLVCACEWLRRERLAIYRREEQEVIVAKVSNVAERLTHAALAGPILVMIGHALSESAMCAESPDSDGAGHRGGRYATRPRPQFNSRSLQTTRLAQRSPSHRPR